MKAQENSIDDILFWGALLAAGYAFWSSSSGPALPPPTGGSPKPTVSPVSPSQTGGVFGNTPPLDELIRRGANRSRNMAESMRDIPIGAKARQDSGGGRRLSGFSLDEFGSFDPYGS